MTPLITLEEHWICPDVAEYGTLKMPDALAAKLRDLGEGRIEDMEAGNVTRQILSHGPHAAPIAPCIVSNDKLAAACKAHPSRFSGFAALSMASPEESAEELKRCITDLGFVGALIDNHREGEFYDAEKFWPVFRMAEKLDVPIYLHPSPATDEWKGLLYKGNYSDTVSLALSTHGFGWHAETALHVLRLFAAGLFDTFPKLKIIIGHMGEMLPFQLDRICSQADSDERGWGLQRKLQSVWDENIWVTTAGMFSLAPLACLLRSTKIERILYSVDYPFSTNTRGATFLDEVKGSGLVSDADFDLIAYRNAETLLRIKA